MHALTTSFTYEVGEIVYIRGALHCEGCRPEPYLISQQVAVRNEVGTQLLYNLIGRSSLVSEIALTDVEPPFQASEAETKEN